MEKQISLLQEELARKVQGGRDMEAQLKEALEKSAKLRRKVNRFSSYSSSGRRRPSKLNEIGESVKEDSSSEDEFLRDEDTDLNISHSVLMGKNERSLGLSDSRERRSGSVGKGSPVDRKHFDMKDEVNDTQLSLTDLEQEEMTNLGSSLNYSLDTATMGMHSMKGKMSKGMILHNNLQNVLKEAAEDGRELRDTTTENDQTRFDSSFNFNLSLTDTPERRFLGKVPNHDLLESQQRGSNPNSKALMIKDELDSDALEQ